jgi:GntR family transcriptional regulator
VVGLPPQPPAEEELRRTAARLAVQARAAGVDGDAVLAIVRAALLQPGLTPPG